jgi:hypothetical protein
MPCAGIHDKRCAVLCEWRHKSQTVPCAAIMHTVPCVKMSYTVLRAKLYALYTEHTLCTVQCQHTHCILCSASTHTVSCAVTNTHCVLWSDRTHTGPCPMQRHEANIVPRTGIEPKLCRVCKNRTHFDTLRRAKKRSKYT